MYDSISPALIFHSPETEWTGVLLAVFQVASFLPFTTKTTLAIHSYVRVLEEIRQ